MNNDYEDYYRFLENLRQSGMINMYGAAPYLQEEFDLNKQDAVAILLNWMRNYDEICQKIYRR